MNDRLPPEPDAKARIRAIGEKEILTFFNEVSPKGLRGLAEFLPNVAGFRKKSDAGLVKQKEMLAKRVGRQNPDDRDYRGLYLLWRTWIDEKLAIAKDVQALIDDLEKAVDAAEGAEQRHSIVKEHVDRLFERLKDESSKNACTREQIQTLFTFSPFPETPATGGMIAAAKSAADVARDIELKKLPDRIQHNEDELKTIEARLKDFGDRLARTAAVVEPAAPQLESLRSAVLEAKATAEKACGGVEKLVPEMESLRDTVSEAKEAAERACTAVQDLAAQAPVEPIPAVDQGHLQRIQALGDDIERAMKAIHEIGGKLSAFSDLTARVDRLAAAQREHLGERNKRDIDAVTENRAITDTINALAERVNAIERRPDVVAPLPVPLYEQENHNEPKDPHQQEGSNERPNCTNHFGASNSAIGLRWEPLRAVDGEPAALQSLTNLALAFARALQSVGLRKTSAQLLAEECAAAVASRQAVILKGSSATGVARALARVVGGPASARLSIPVGMQDGDQLRFSIAEAAASHTKSVAAIAIDGINRTALDVTKDVLSECLDPAYSGTAALTGHIAVFASLAHGMASLTVEPAYFELGPIFDLDYLDWRTNNATDLELPWTFLPAEVDRSIFAQVTSASADIEEARRLAQLFVAKRNPTVERIVTRAYQALHLTRTDPKVVTPLQSLVYGWLIPYWIAMRRTKEQVDSELDSGKVNGSTVDARLKAMLNSEFADTGGSNDAP